MLRCVLASACFVDASAPRGRCSAARSPSGPARAKPRAGPGRACRRRRAWRRGSPRRRAGAGCAARRAGWPGSAARLLRRDSRAELIGPAQDDRPHQLLDRPAVADEPGRQVVEQLGVRRRVAGDAEVVDARDQPLAEQVLPDAVDHHARRERVLRRWSATAASSSRPLCCGLTFGGAGDVERRSGSRAARSGRASRPRRGCGSRCRRPSCASRTPRADRAVGGRVGQGEQLGLEP